MTTRHGSKTSSMASAAATCVAVLTTMSGIGIVILMVVTVADVTLRALRGAGVRGSIEIVEVGMLFVVFLGAIGAESSRSHIRTPVVVERFSPPVATVLRLVGLLLSTVTLLWLTYATGDAALSSWERRETRFGLLGLPLWPARLLIPIMLLGCAAVVAARATATARMVLMKRYRTYESSSTDLF